MLIVRIYGPKVLGWSVKGDSRESKTVVFIKNASRYQKPVKLLE